MTKFSKMELRKLCSPALLYFMISMTVWVMVALQNLSGDRNTLYIGSVQMYVPNVIVIFIFKLIYILFWTWILNLICKDGHSTISWLLVLAPLILSVLSMATVTN